MGELSAVFKQGCMPLNNIGHLLYIRFNAYDRCLFSANRSMIDSFIVLFKDQDRVQVFE